MFAELIHKIYRAEWDWPVKRVAELTIQGSLSRNLFPTATAAALPMSQDKAILQRSAAIEAMPSG